MLYCSLTSFHLLNSEKSAKLKTACVPKIGFRQLKKFVYLKAGSANLKKFVYLKSGSANFNLKIFVYLKSGPQQICILPNLACGKGPQKRIIFQHGRGVPAGVQLGQIQPGRSTRQGWEKRRPSTLMLREKRHVWKAKVPESRTRAVAPLFARIFFV